MDPSGALPKQTCSDYWKCGAGILCEFLRTKSAHSIKTMILFNYNRTNEPIYVFFPRFVIFRIFTMRKWFPLFPLFIGTNELLHCVHYSLHCDFCLFFFDDFSIECENSAMYQQHRIVSFVYIECQKVIQTVKFIFILAYIYNVQYLFESSTSASFHRCFWFFCFSLPLSSYLLYLSVSLLFPHSILRHSIQRS